MFDLMDTTIGKCFLCEEPSTQEKEGFDFCQECFDKIDGKILVLCYKCEENYGILDWREGTILKICAYNSMSRGKVNQEVFNTMLTIARNTNASIFPIRGCPKCI